MIVILKKVKTSINTHKPVKTALSVGALIVALFAVYTAGYVKLEGTSVVEGVWQSWQTFTTVGYGNAPATTDWGRLFSMAIGTIGIAVMAVLIAVLSEMRQYFREQKRLGFMKSKFENGYVVVNWPGKVPADKVITQLRHSEPNVPICFVDSQLEALPPSIQALGNIQFVRGNLTNKETYENANVRKNKAVFVLPSDPEHPDADITTKSIAELMLKFVNGDTAIICMLCDSENKWMFPKNIKLVMKNLWVFAMVQEVQDNGSSSLVEKLINNADGESVNSLKVGKTTGIEWGSVKNLLDKEGVNPIGLLRHGQTHLLPNQNTPIETNDTIFLACGNDRNLKEIHDKVFN